MKIILIPNNQTMAARHYCIAKELQSQGHEVTYFMWQHPFNIPFRKLVEHAFTSLIPKTYTHESFTVHKAVRLPFFWPIINGWIFKTQLRRLYDTLGADIIFTEGYTNETEVPKDLPYIYDLADDYNGPAKVYGSSIYKFAFKLLDVEGVMRRQCQHAKAVTAVSSALYSYAKNLNDNTIMMPNGVEPELIERALSEKNKINQHSIVYATGFGPWSRAIETLETITELRKEFPNISLTLVGAGTEVPKIKQYIDEHNAHDYIHYIEYIYDRKELFALLSKHAIGLNISDKNVWRDASHPMKVMDYSALGMKVVSTNLTEVKKLGYDNIFIFTDTGKNQGLKTVLRKALKDTRDSYKEITNKVLDKYDWGTIVSPLISASEQVVRDKVAISDQAFNKDHIIHVTYSYPPAIGGLEQVAQQLATAQAEAGAMVSVITSNKGCNSGQDMSNGVIVKRLKSFVVANTTIIPSLLLHLLRIKSNDTVHLHIAQAFTPEVVWLASKIRGFRYIAHVHIDVPPSGWAGFLLRIYKPFVLGKVLRDAHGVAVFTNEQKQILGDRYHLEPNRVHVIPNGVAKEFFVSKRKNIHKKPRLLFVGRLSYQKNLKQLLDALNGISNQFDTTIVGDGELKQELIAYAKELKLKNIKFVGFANGDSLRNYYKQADIFVLTSEREGMPLVLLEAMAARLPIVATRVTGNKDVVKHRKNGLLVPYNNANALRAALLNLASDNIFYKSLSNNAAKMAMKFTWSAVRERFAAIYPRQQIIPLKSAGSIQKEHTYKLPTVIIPLLILSVASYAIPNVLGSIITLLFFLTIPGYLLLRRITSNFDSWWERTSMSVVLSILIIMVGGLFLNALHYIGIDRPLATINIFIMLSLSTLLLVWFNRKEKIDIKLSKLKSPSKTYLAVTIVLTLLPILAIGGAIRLNNGASNILTMIMFGLIATIFLVIIIKKELRPLYSYALFMFAISILLSTSLRGWSITGHDIRHEFQVFQSTNSRAFWLAVVPSYDPYNSCLSISILPTILYNIAHIPAEYIYKAVYQVVFAFGIAPMFYVFRKFLLDNSALLAGFIFITFPVFINDLTFLNRQEIAFLFFVSLISVTFSKIAKHSKYVLTILLLIGILLSHYSTNYVTVALLITSFVIYKILTHYKTIRTNLNIPLLSMPVILFAIITTYTWGALITQTSPNIERTITRAVNAIKSSDTIRSSTTRFSILGTKQQTPQEILKDYAGEQINDIEYVKKDFKPLTQLGKSMESFINVENTNSLVQSSIARIYQVLVIFGVVIMFIRNIAIKKNRQITMNNAYLVAIACGSVILLVMLTILPYVSVSYDVSRLFMQTLVITAIPIVIAGEFIFKITRNATYATAILFTFVFLFISGFIPQLTGGYDPKISLANSGTYYNFFYEHTPDKVSSRWLADNRDESIKVFLDTDASTKLPIYVSAGLLHQDTSSGYIFESYRNTTAGVYRVFPNGELIEYSDVRVTTNRSLIYNNQGSTVYSPKIGND